MDACPHENLDSCLPEVVKSGSKADVSGGNQNPPCFLNLLLALQHLFVQASLLVLVVGVLKQHLPPEAGGREELLSSMLFYSCLSTLVQSFLGTCLPVIHTPSLATLVPALVLATHIISDSNCRGSCEENEEENPTQTNPLKELQGMTLVAGLIQLILGATGLGGVVLRHCGPLVIAPLLCMLGFSMYREAALLCSDNWAVTALVVILVVGMSQHLRYFLFPACLRLPRLPVCRMLSVLLSLLCVLAVCATLESLDYLRLHSVSELLPALGPRNMSHQVPTDRNVSSSSALWFSLPLAAETGLPMLSARCIAAGVIAGFSSSVSSVGVYVLTARLQGAPPLPEAACNRGLGAQGLCSVMAGLVGAPLGLCCSVPNCCVFGLSQAGSRRTVQLAAILGLTLGLSPRMTQAFTSVPMAVYGAVLMVTHTIAVAMGVMYFQFTHIDSGRNIFNIGFAVFMSLVLPRWFRIQSDFIDTGMASIDVLLQSLLISPVLLVGILAFLLDNTVSGSLAERGLVPGENWTRGRTGLKSEPGAGQRATDYHQEVALVYDSPYLLTRLWDLPVFRTCPLSAFRLPDNGEVL
ncbi:hypothetical protein UPYG_G00159450 [Umbra pygmaea]|uniref:Solute carrier family 23 member 3 n=1 Tax=Umbra pygmaea TaxID=75934 RepID=A0ABD0XLJ7_UMBPY